MINTHHTIPRDSFTFMTNGNCEVASVTEKQLNDAGLPYQKASDMGVKEVYGDTFYPLTRQEDALISQDTVGLSDEDILFYTSYTALYSGKKYLALVCELNYENETEQVNAKKINDSLLNPLGCIALVTGGQVYRDIDGEPEESWNNNTGYYTTILFIPFEFALKKAACFSEWSVYLTGILDGSFGAFKAKQQ